MEFIGLLCFDSSPIQGGDDDGRSRDICIRVGITSTMGRDVATSGYREDAAGATP